MSDLLAFLEQTADVSPTDRALTRPGKALVRVKASFAKLPEDQRTPETFMMACESAGVPKAAAEKVCAFAWQMFGRRETTKPVPTKGGKS